jgi:hypothetical protein
MYFGLPTLKEYLFYPFSFGLLALAIARRFPSPEADVFLWAVEINVALVPSVFLIRQFVEQAENEHLPYTSKPANDTQSERKLIDLNTGNVIYPQSTQALKIDCVSRFNRELLTQKASKLPVIMTEGYWNDKAGDELLSNWQKIGGVGITDWKDMMKRAVTWGAYAEIGGQRKRVPADWSKIRMLSNGFPLPQ